MKKTTDHEHHDRRFVTATQPGQQGNWCVIMQGCTHSFYPFHFNMLAHMNIFGGMQFCGTAGGEDVLGCSKSRSLFMDMTYKTFPITDLGLMQM